MSNFVDMGNMRASLDRKTGKIRITSGEKGSILKNRGFMMNVQPGSKEYEMISEMITPDYAGYPSVEDLGKTLDSMTEEDPPESKARKIVELREWHPDSARYQATALRIITQLLKAEAYCFEISDEWKTEQKDQPWAERILDFLDFGDNVLLFCLEVDVDNDAKSLSLMKKVSKFFTPEKESLKIQELHESSKMMRYMAEAKIKREKAITAENASKFPKIIHLSDKYRSADPLNVPIGVDIDRKTVYWNVKEKKSLLVDGGTGSGKTVLLRTILDHVHNNPLKLQGFFYDSKAFPDPRYSISQYFSTFHENIEANEHSRDLSIFTKAHKLMVSRRNFIEKNPTADIEQLIYQGIFKRTFFFIDEISPVFYIGEEDREIEFSLSHEERSRLLNEILTWGTDVGIHTIISAQSLGTDWPGCEMVTKFVHTEENTENTIVMKSTQGDAFDRGTGNFYSSFKRFKVFFTG